jgi:hypothetical protein
LQWQHPLPQGNDLFRMAGFADGSYYAVGEAGTVIQFNNGTVTNLESPAREELRGLWAPSPDTLYVCGMRGTLLRRAGAGWDSIHIPSDEDLYDVWGSSTNDIFVAGSRGNVWNLQDEKWTSYAVAPQSRLRALWGYSHDELYTAGSHGALFRFDGSQWHQMLIYDEPVLDVEVFDLWGAGPGSISLVDRWNILWFNSGTWKGISLTNDNGLGLWGFALNQQIAVSSGYSQNNGRQNDTYPTTTDEPLFDVVGPLDDRLPRCRQKRNHGPF